MAFGMNYDEAMFNKYWSENENGLLAEFLERESPCLPVKDWDAYWHIRFTAFVKERMKANVKTV